MYHIFIRDFIKYIITSKALVFFFFTFLQKKKFLSKTQTCFFKKSIEPFDDLYVHPIEVAGYYMILYSPPFLFSIHWSSFLVYMIIMGICGVIDHSGIRFEIYGLYNTTDHGSFSFFYSPKIFFLNFFFPIIC